MHRTLVLTITALMLAGCVTLHEVATPADELQEMKTKISEYQASLSTRFLAGELNYASVARLRSAYTKTLAAESEAWKLDSWDLEYHQFKILLAARLDAKKLTVEEAKYQDIKMANEIKEKARRAGHPNWRLLW